MNQKFNRRLTFTKSIIITSLFFTTPFAIADTGSGPLGWGRAELTQEMETDRPDFTEGTQPIASGHFQVEGGYTYTSADSTDEHVLPELLGRFGLSDDAELRLGWAGYVHGDEEDGLANISVGFKHSLVTLDDSSTAFSWIGQLELPTGDDDVAADRVIPEIKFLWAHPLEDNLGVAGNINGAVPYEDGDRFFEAAASLSLAYDIDAIWGSYAEYFGIYPEEGNAENYLNGGLTYAVSDDLQLDARVGFGLDNDSADLFTGVGVAFRQ
jgi:hypothetical protein